MSRITVRLLQRCAAEVFGISLNAINARRRNQSITRPRHCVDYLAREMTPLSFPEIGRYNGGRDHSTVIHGGNACEENMARDPDYARQVRMVRKLALLRCVKPFYELPPLPVPPPPPEPEPVIETVEQALTYFKPGDRLPEYLIDTLGDDDWISLNVASAYSREAA